MYKATSNETVPLFFGLDDGWLKDQVINRLMIGECWKRNNRGKYDNRECRINHSAKLGLNVVVFFIAVDGAGAIDLFSKDQAHQHMRKDQLG